MQVSPSPIALWTRSAVTEESPPPLMPQTTLLPPTVRRISSTLVSMNDFLVQRGFVPQMLNRKFLNILAPSWVCATSGWNCTPKTLPPMPLMAQFGELALWAMEENPAGSLSTLSPWLIQTFMLFCLMPLKRSVLSSIASSAPPYSLFLDLSTPPPRSFEVSCMP